MIAILSEVVWSYESSLELVQLLSALDQTIAKSDGPNTVTKLCTIAAASRDPTC